MTTALASHTGAPAVAGNGAPGDGRKRRLRFRPRPGALPLVLLLLALSALFLFGGDREYFYKGVHHDWNSAQTLAFAENLSFRHNLLIFHHRYRDAAGDLHYPSPYNRFPPGGYALVKLAILPFGDTDFRAKIYAGRMLMLLLFSASAVLAYLALARIVGSRWDALTATLLAFSSYYLLHYADKISNETTASVFAVLLVFHGMTVFVQEGRFGQLLVKSCAGLLLGWDVYAILLTFIAFGLSAELLKNRRRHPFFMLDNLKWYVAALLRSRYLLLGIATLLFGIAVMTFNFGNEYFALKGDAPLRELPSVASAVRRVGLDAGYRAHNAPALEPQVFWPNQFYRVTMTTLPFAVNIFTAKIGPVPNFRYQDYPAMVSGVLAAIFGLVALAVICVQRRTGMATLLATLAVSGFCYAALFRHNVVIHDFGSVFYIGFPLAIYTLALLCLRRMSTIRLSPLFAVAALAAFIFSVSAMADTGQSRAELAIESAEMDEYRAIWDLVDAEAAIYVPTPYLGLERSGGAPWAWAFYLSGKNTIFNDGLSPRKPQQDVDYLLLLAREDSPALLTPEHQHIFLYDWTLYDEWLRTVDRGRPVIAEDWQVYLRDGRLTYVSQECANQDDLFLLHFIPQDTADLHPGRQEYGYSNADFDFQRYGITLSDGTCVVERPLPEYDIAAIRTGQYNAEGRIWQGEFIPSPDSRLAKSE